MTHARILIHPRRAVGGGMKPRGITRAPPGDYDDFDDPVHTENLHGISGSLHSVSANETPENRVRDLRVVVAEVTRNRIPVPERRGPGFL